MEEEEDWSRWSREERLEFLQCCFPLLSRLVLEECVAERALESSERVEDWVDWIINRQKSEIAQHQEDNDKVVNSNDVDKVNGMDKVDNGSNDADSNELLIVADPEGELARIFPNLQLTEIQSALSACSNDFHLAFEELLLAPLQQDDSTSTTSTTATAAAADFIIKHAADETQILKLFEEFNGDIGRIQRFLDNQNLLSDPCISQLQDIFPHISLSQLSRTLADADGNVQTAITILCSHDDLDHENHNSLDNENDHNSPIDPAIEPLVSMFPNLDISYISAVNESFQSDENKVIDWLVCNPDPGSALLPPPPKQQRKKRTSYIPIPSDFVFDKDDKHSLLQVGAPDKSSSSSSASASRQRDPQISYANIMRQERSMTLAGIKSNFARPVNEILNNQSSPSSRRNEDNDGFWGSDVNALRQTATNAFADCKGHFQKAMEYYRKGRHGPAIAAYYAQLGKRSHRIMQIDNRRASELIFRQNNPEYPDKLIQIDLHGLFVTEAIRYVDQVLDLWLSSQQQRKITFVTGWGMHSDDNHSKMRASVYRHLCRLGERRNFDISGSPGSITVIQRR